MNMNHAQHSVAKSPSADSLSSEHKSTMGQGVQGVQSKPQMGSQLNNANSNANQSQNQSSMSTGNAANAQNGSSSTGTRRTAAPVSPESAMRTHMAKLSTFEHHEIFNYPEVYFVGPNAKKIHGVIGGPNNNGYDDENGS
jgi:hypothetical protein